MADADFSGVTNPKRVLQRREEEAEHGKKPAAAASAPGGGMPQSSFGNARKLTPAQEQMKQKKLVEKMRQRGDF